MADWVTISSLATAGGTLVLAVATFSSVKSANRSARVAEKSLLAGLAPLLTPSREEDPVERIRFGDGQVITVPGHGGTAEERDGIIFMGLALRNGGSGAAVIQGWRASARRNLDPHEVSVRDRTGPDNEAPDLERFRRQQLDLIIPAGETGYWQGALRDPELEGYDAVRSALQAEDVIQIDLLYADQYAGQRTVGRFIISEWPTEDGERPFPGAQRASAIRYWRMED